MSLRIIGSALVLHGILLAQVPVLAQTPFHDRGAEPKRGAQVRYQPARRIIERLPPVDNGPIRPGAMPVRAGQPLHLPRRRVPLHLQQPPETEPVQRVNFEQQISSRRAAARAEFVAPDASQRLKSEPMVANLDTPQELPPQSTTELFADPVDLTDLTLLAIEANPILVRALAEIESAKGERVQAGLYPNPRFETNNPEIWAGEQAYVNFGWQQDLVTKGKIRLDKAAADQLVRRLQASYQLETSRMLTAVRSQYYQTVAVKQRCMLAQYIAQVASRSLDAAKQLEQAGELSLTDVLLLDSELQRAYTELDSSRALLQGELKQLSATVGIPDSAISDVAGSLFDAPPIFDEEEVRAFVASESSYLAVGRATIQRNAALLRRAEVEPYPNLRFGPAYQTGTQSGTSQFWLSIVFDIPIWDLNQGNIRKARAELARANADIDVVRNDLLRQAAEIYARYDAARRVADRIRTAILPNAQRTVDLVYDGFSKGQFDVNRLLEAQRILSNVAQEHLQAAEASWISSVELAGLLQLEQFP